LFEGISKREEASDSDSDNSEDSDEDKKKKKVKKTPDLIQTNPINDLDLLMGGG